MKNPQPLSVRLAKVLDALEIVTREMVENSIPLA
jgi:hypothetical protein